MKKSQAARKKADTEDTDKTVDQEEESRKQWENTDDASTAAFKRQSTWTAANLPTYNTWEETTHEDNH